MKDLHETEKDVSRDDELPEVKTPWQLTKESWYDKVNLTVKQLDIIIGCATAALIITAIVIALDAMGIF